jgi:hypothetical protein
MNRMNRSCIFNQLSISDLESEMYQLSHMLTEQRSLLSSLATSSLLGDKIPSVVDCDGTTSVTGEGEEQKEKEESRRKLAAILEKVEGCVVCILCHCKYSDHLADVVPSIVCEDIV